MMEYPIDESLLWRYFDKKVNEEEKCAVEDWVNSSEENKEMAHKVARIYFATGLLRTSKEVENRNELNKFWNKSERRKVLRMWRNVGRIAAVLLLPVVIFSIYLFTGRESAGMSEQMVEVRTQVGITNSVVLPDSSIVYLNSASVLKYPVHFTGNRNVYLQGEAYFVVRKQNGARFVVNTAAGAKIEVLGTEFNVNSNADDVNTTLVKGSVKFVCQNKNDKEEDIRMVPGQKISYNLKDKAVEIREVNVDDEIEWRNEKTVFKDCPLMETLAILSKRFNAQFVVKNEALKENRFTGSFKNQSLEQILENFTISTNMKYRYVNKRAVVNAGSEREIIELY